MLILVAELVIGAILYRTLHSGGMRAAAVRAVLLAGLWTIMALAVVQWELAYLSPDGTYGSDARYYYKEMRATVESRAWWPAEGTLSPGYVAWGAAVLHLSPTDSVVWVKLANVGLFLLVVLIGFTLFERWDVSPSTAYLATLMYAVNGTVTWMVVRNLKDTVLLFLTMAHIWLTLRALHAKRQAMSRVFVAALLAVAAGAVYKTIRPWGSYWSGAVLMGSVLEVAWASLHRQNLSIPGLALYSQ